MGQLSAIADSDIIDGFSIWFLKIFGTWNIINDYRTTGNKNIILKIQVMITLVLTIPSMICQFIALFVLEVDIQKASILNFHTLPLLQILIKHLVFWFSLDSFCRLYDLSRKDFLDKSLHDIERERAESIYRKVSKLSNKTCIVIFFVIEFSGLFIVSFPGVSVDYILYHTGNMQAITTGRKKVSTGWYPLPMDTSPSYEIILVVEGLAVMWSCSFISMFLGLYYQLLMSLNAQFMLLGSHISSLKIDHEYEKNSIEYKEINDQKYSELNRILQDHQKLLSFADELRSIYNPLVTINLGMGTSILIIAVFQFLFGQSGDIMLVTRSVLYLSCQGVEVWIFCYGSSVIESTSSDLHFAIYSSDWYKADIKFRKAAQMLMVRSKKGVTLTAIRMYPVNLETIMSILQFTYSVATLMSGLME